MTVDDVITAGTAIRESKAIIDANGATLAGVLVCLDREERGKEGTRSAIMEVSLPCPLSLHKERESGSHARWKGPCVQPTPVATTRWCHNSSGRTMIHRAIAAWPLRTANPTSQTPSWSGRAREAGHEHSVRASIRGVSVNWV